MSTYLSMQNRPKKKKVTKNYLHEKIEYFRIYLFRLLPEVKSTKTVMCPGIRWIYPDRFPALANSLKQLAHADEGSRLVAPVGRFVWID